MQTSKIARTLEFSELFSLYKDLLPEKQALYLRLYLDEDLSLQEIADNFAVSKNAIYDSITKALANLASWEASLKIKTYKTTVNQIFQKYQDSQITEVQEILAFLKE